MSIISRIKFMLFSKVTYFWHYSGFGTIGEMVIKG